MSGLRFVRLGFGADAVEYQEAWEEQRRVHAARFADEIPDTCLLLEHPPVYTAGRRTADNERPLDGTPVVDVDRGGKITWHGPGQLVGYPILKLPRPVDVVAHVRRLEEALIRTCAEFGLETTRVEGRSGVWVLGDPVEQRPALGGLSLDFDPRLHGRGVRPAAERPGVRPVQRRPAPRGPQARRDRHPRRQGRHDARLRAQREPGQHLVRPDRAVRHPGRGRRPRSRTSWAGTITIAEVLPVVERHLRDVLENARTAAPRG